MSNDRADEIIKTKICNSERTNIIPPQLADELWGKLGTKRSIKPVRKNPTVFIRAAAALLILGGALLVFMQPGRNKPVVDVKERSVALPVAPASRGNDSIPKPGMAAIRQGDDSKTKPGITKNKSKRKSVNMISMAKVSAQLEHVQDPLITARLEIEMIAVKGGELDIKDRIEF